MDDAEKEIAKLEVDERARNERRRQLLITAGVVAVLAGVAVWYFVLRDARSSCEKLVGPVAELETMTGKALKMSYGHATKYSCRQEVDEKARVGGYVVEIETEERADLESVKRTAGAAQYVGHEAFQTALGTAELFIAGKTAGPSAQELELAARRRVGYSSDPIGDVLSGLPPSQHLVLLRDGHGLISIKMFGEMFTADQVKTYATAVARRAAP